MTVCRFCGQAGKLVKAHAIPEAFFRELRDGQNPPRLVTSTAGTFPRKAPIGVYDQEMLCGNCEPKFGPLDDYGSEVLIRRFADHFTPVHHAGEVFGYESASVDGPRLLRFLVAVLWRASMSRQPFYRGVDLATSPHFQ